MLREIAENARKERESETSVLTGFCYENAECMSRHLEQNGINHELHYIGLIEDIIQFSDASLEDCLHASETGEYRDNVPSTISELPDEANHYTIVVKAGGQNIVVEICTEVRDERFGGIYVDSWPEKDYLSLEDSVLNKKSKFSHY